MKDLIARLTVELNGHVDRATLDSVRDKLERAYRDLDRRRREAESNSVSLAAEVDRLGAAVSQLEREAADRRVEVESLEQRLRDADLGRRRAEAALDRTKVPVVDASKVDWDLLEYFKDRCEGPKAIDFLSDLIVSFHRSCVLTAVRGYNVRLAGWIARLKPPALSGLMHLACSELSFWSAVYGDQTPRKFGFAHLPIDGIKLTERVKEDLGPNPRAEDLVDAIFKGDVVVDGDCLKAKGE